MHLENVIFFMKLLATMNLYLKGVAIHGSRYKCFQ